MTLVAVIARLDTTNGRPLRLAPPAGPVGAAEQHPRARIRGFGIRIKRVR